LVSIARTGDLSHRCDSAYRIAAIFRTAPALCVPVCSGVSVLPRRLGVRERVCSGLDFVYSIHGQGAFGGAWNYLLACGWSCSGKQGTIVSAFRPSKGPTKPQDQCHPSLGIMLCLLPHSAAASGLHNADGQVQVGCATAERLVPLCGRVHGLCEKRQRARSCVDGGRRRSSTCVTCVHLVSMIRCV
jgi:hypothetical protein